MVLGDTCRRACGKRRIELLCVFTPVMCVYVGQPLVAGSRNHHPLLNSVAAHVPYSGKLVHFTERTLADCSLVSLKDVTPPHFTEKTFVNSRKTSKFAKVFYLESFTLFSKFIRYECSDTVRGRNDERLTYVVTSEVVPTLVSLSKCRINAFPKCTLIVTASYE